MARSANLETLVTNQFGSQAAAYRELAGRLVVAVSPHVD